jgi:hypothetical protein
MSEIRINGFSGINNVKKDEAFLREKGIAEPRVILNADVDITGKLNIRGGKSLFVNIAGAHSLWAGSCMLCAASGTLYRISQGVAVSIGTIAGPQYPLSYEEVENKVYISNPYWQGVFNPSDNSLSSWGVPQPSGAMLLSGTGNLPAGTYHVTMTNVSNGELSGNGPITEITLSAEGGIQVLNRPSGALIWITVSDEPIFYLVGAIDKIVDVPTVEPLPSFMCTPPPPLENLCYAFGRMWGSNGQVLYHSEPYNLGWFRLTANKFSYDSPITLIARVSSGLFVGTEEATYFLAGKEPSAMAQSDAGAGSIRGTLAYCNNLPDLSSVLGTPEKGFVDVPVWLTKEGIVAGNDSGRVFNLTKNRVRMSIPARGASLYRNLDGVFHFLTTFKQGVIGSGTGTLDEETASVFKNGKIDVHNERANSMGGIVGFSDTATCTVTRGGVEI